MEHLEFAALLEDVRLARLELTRRQSAFPETSPEHDRLKTHAERSYQRALANVRNEQKLQMQIERHQVFLAREGRRAIIEGVKIEAIEADRKVTQELAQFNNSKEPIQVKDGEAHVKQAIYVSTEDDINVIDEVVPSNAEVRSLIAQRHTFPVPPAEVIRYYHFCDGAKIQPNFEFLLANEEMRDAIEPMIPVPLSFAEFRSISLAEDATFAHPDPSEPLQCEEA